MAEAIEIPAHVPPERVIRFDFRNDAAIRRDPWSYIAGLDRRPDIFFSPDLGGYWVVTRAALIDEVFSRHDLFTATSLAIPKRDSSLVLIPNNLDPPAHASYRKVLANGLFSPRALGPIEEDTRSFSRALFASFAPGRCEFVQDYAYKLPIDIFLNLMGADLALRDECLSWIKLIFRGRDLDETNAGFTAAYRWVDGWLREQLMAPDRNRGTMFQAMVASQVDGRALDFDEMVSITLMLFTGGLDTITSQMTHIMRFLADHLAHRRQLVDDPGLIPMALEELLRRFGISFIGRAVARDTIYHGVEMKAGDAICAGTPIAGLDPRAFPDPLAVDFGRGEGRRVKHLGFGSGPHMCIGAYLARTQLTVMLEHLLPLMPDLRVRPGAEIEMLPGATMMLARLPLEWTA